MLAYAETDEDTQGTVEGITKTTTGTQMCITYREREGERGNIHVLGCWCRDSTHFVHSLNFGNIPKNH